MVRVRVQVLVLFHSHILHNTVVQVLFSTSLPLVSFDVHGKQMKRNTKNKQQQELPTSFFKNGATAPRKRIKTIDAIPFKTATDSGVSPLKSRFQCCPICSRSLPFHLIETHAASCTGEISDAAFHEIHPTPSLFPTAVIMDRSPVVRGNLHQKEEVKNQWRDILQSKASTEKNGCDDAQSYQSMEGLPGLHIFEEFISEEEEEAIIRHLDHTRKTTTTADTAAIDLPWKSSKFNGRHHGKRWGVHCDLRHRKVRPGTDPLPSWIVSIVTRIQELRCMDGCAPNEANAIDYRRVNGDHLKSHVDDRQLSKEPIANLSLAGDCRMLFRHEQRGGGQRGDSWPMERRVMLKRRTLQVITGRARYDYSHGIENQDLLSDRRLSITMRESPLTK